MRDVRPESEIMKSWRGDTSTPIVSVSCLTFNHEKFIEDALEGFLIQKTDFPFEVLIHDDASTDRTPKILAEYQKKYPRLFRCFYQAENTYTKPNKKEFRKPFLDAPKGKYIALCDGDDFWTDPLKIMKQVNLLENNQCYSMCFSNSTVCDVDGRMINPSRVPGAYKRDVRQIDILNGFCPPTNTILLRSDYLNAIRSYMTDKVINMDYFISCLMAEYGEIGYMDEVVAAYRKHNKGIWSNISEYERDINLFHLFETLKEYIGSENRWLVEEKTKKLEIDLQMKNLNELFLVDGYWTPQTVMLRSIRDIVIKMEGKPQRALSIDINPSLEKILIRKWPYLEIHYAKYPECDAQNLFSLLDESFDIVFSHQVLEHVPKPWLAGKEIVRVLKRGGIGIHTSCAFNPRHGHPAFKDYYRFLPDGLAELFDGVNMCVKDGWGSREALLYNLAIDDGHKELGGRRFVEALGRKNEVNYPWHTWVIFQKN